MVKSLYCSFCGKSEHEVEHTTVAGDNGVAICCECVEMCVDIIADYRANKQLFVAEDW